MRDQLLVMMDEKRIALRDSTSLSPTLKVLAYVGLFALHVAYDFTFKPNHS
jgi:hypothetical protein